MERRFLLKGLVALVAAPAIIKVAGIMPVKASLQPHNLLTPHQITRAAVKMWADSNRFLQEIDEQYAQDVGFASGEQWENSPGFVQRVNQAYDEQFGAQGAKIGDVLRIRLPNDYLVTDGHGLSLQIPARAAVPDKLVLAAAAIAVVPTILKTPVTRRFWSLSHAEMSNA
jgi:hypothetical protein